MALQLDSPLALPSSYVVRLSRFHSVLAATDFWESARETPELLAIETELEKFLRSQTIEAYHCTKEPSPGFFEAAGLRPTDLQTHQHEFMVAYGHQFSVRERQDIQSAWDHYFHRDPMAKRGRNGMVWACLRRTDVLSDGTEPFFDLFGGEAVFMPLKNHATVADKLRKLGKPVVVEFTIQARDFITFHPLAYQVLSRYHHEVNTSAMRYTIEGRTLQPVSPSEVLRVTPRDQFTP